MSTELMTKFAFPEGVISKKEDYKKDINLIYEKLEDDRITDKTWWSKDFKGSFEKKEKSDWYNVLLEEKVITSVCNVYKLLELKDILLEFGGNDVCMNSYEEDLYNLLSRGQLWINKRGRIRKMKGRPNQCHKNSCNLWEANHENFDVHICTGYALASDDGLWRQHSWLVYIDNGTPKIIETTVKWSAYYGYVMTKDECIDFCDDNF